MINLKCRKLYMWNKEFCCLVKNKEIKSCDENCQDMIISNAWKKFLEDEKWQ